MADNLTAKLLRSHLAAGQLVPDQDITVAVDQILIEDATGTMTAMQFEMLDAAEVSVPLAVLYVDHNVLQIDDKTMPAAKEKVDVEQDPGKDLYYEVTF